MDLEKDPTLHIFGHDYDYFGVEKRGFTTFMNMCPRLNYCVIIVVDNL